MTEMLFPKSELPRTSAPRVMMHVCDAGDHGCGGVEPGEQWVKYLCDTCGHTSEWHSAPSISAAKRGIPCPVCNSAKPSQAKLMSCGLTEHEYHEELASAEDALRPFS